MRKAVEYEIDEKVNGQRCDVRVICNCEKGRFYRDLRDVR